MKAPKHPVHGWSIDVEAGIREKPRRILNPSPADLRGYREIEYDGTQTTTGTMALWAGRAARIWNRGNYFQFENYIPGMRGRGIAVALELSMNGTMATNRLVGRQQSYFRSCYDAGRYR